MDFRQSPSSVRCVRHTGSFEIFPNAPSFALCMHFLFVNDLISLRSFWCRPSTKTKDHPLYLIGKKGFSPRFPLLLCRKQFVWPLRYTMVLQDLSMLT